MSLLEAVAVALALAMVFCNIREIHWGWPLAAASSLIYFVVFRESKLYGDASLQVFFAAVALWGWYQWLRGHREDGASLHVMRLKPRGLLLTFIAGAMLWPAAGWFLKTYTDTDVPWWDGFNTGMSVVGQFLLGRKFIENWAVWVAVNIVSVGLFAYKGLWLTVGLYAVFIVLSFVGWREWKRRLA